MNMIRFYYWILMMVLILIPSLTRAQSLEKLPIMGVWVWNTEDLLGNDYVDKLDDLVNNYPYNLIIPFLRFPNYELLDPQVHKRVGEMALYLKGKGIGLVPDLDIRNSRKKFMDVYPNELQQMLRIREVKHGNKKVVITPLLLSDHYSGGEITPYKAVKSQLLRAYSYQLCGDQIIPSTIKNLTNQCRVVTAVADSIVVELPDFDKSEEMSIIVSFDHLYPDIFSPHILSFQRKLIQQYRDIPLSGVCKDEWGFPPYFPRYYKTGYVDYWYSSNYAAAYRKETQRDLIYDCLLMSKSFKGLEVERQVAINVYNKLNFERNVQIEEDFYRCVKDIFGEDAFVTVHPTWWPYPDKNEFKKNGLDWWAVKRDLAQTDEVVPFSVRTALCKKWNSPVWYNMYYKSDLATQMWSSVLAGGRLNYLSYDMLNTEDLKEAERKIHLLNYVSDSPLNSPIALVFGHYNALNWAGNSFEDVGLELVDSLWKSGYPVDLIPTSEITNGSLKVSPDGSVCYGIQHYDAVIIYKPEYENEEISHFIKNVKTDKTNLYYIGDWTLDFQGTSISNKNYLPSEFKIYKKNSELLIQILRDLELKGVKKNSPALGILDNSYFTLRDFNHASVVPVSSGYCRLIDGTYIKISAVNEISGDRITDFIVDGNLVKIDALGVVSVKFSEDRELVSLVAGGLKKVEVNGFTMTLNNRYNIAIKKDENGHWIGFIQCKDEHVPSELLKVTANWTIIR